MFGILFFGSALLAISVALYSLYRNHKAEYRWGVLRLKSRGLLPELSWPDVARSLVTRCDDWPAERLAHPKQEFDGGLVLYETPIGEIAATPAHRRTIGLLVIEQLRGVYQRGNVTVRNGDIVLDLGAHLGTFSRFALSRGAAKVVAFEPEPAHFNALQLTFQKEIREGRVHLINAAAWSEEGSLQFEASGLTSHLAESGPTRVRATTVDAIVASLNLDRVDFIKADIEGAERHAVRGATQTISRFQPRMALCIYHLPDDPTVIRDAVKSLGDYRAFTNPGRTQAFFIPEA